MLLVQQNKKQKPIVRLINKNVSQYHNTLTCVKIIEKIVDNLNR